jgi:CelD/BcsL family acetyltransferase involved in cellulose biosynthesis
MPGADVSIETFATAGSMPPEARSLLDGSGSMFNGSAWWTIVLSDAMPAGGNACFIVCQLNGRTVGIVPLLRRRGSGGWDSLTTPYTCRYSPVLASDLDGNGRVSVLEAFVRYCRRGGAIRLDALPAEWDGLPDLLTAVRLTGLVALQFDHFGNWYEHVAGLNWADYLALRPGALRETIRRRLRQASRLTEAHFTLLTRPVEMDVAAERFESVYRRSWKQVEPFPTFNVALLRAMAELGTVRFAMWSIGAMPVAVQIWIVERTGRATVLKLAHDEVFKTHSPGTVLTALMLQHLLNEEHVTEIDFGRGDDAYKRDWAQHRRQRIGLLLVNPWRPSGALQIARHRLGRLRAAGRGRPD